MKKFYLGIALTMALASCTQEELVNSTNESKLQVSVESNKALSRVGFDYDNNWSFFWHNGDAIWVNGGTMSTDAADKSETATFTGWGVDTSTGYAVYPFEIAKKNVNGTVFTWELPESYIYTEIDADFFDSAQSIPMYAKVNNGSASFKHLGAIVAFKFNDWTLTGEHVFTLTASKKITGEFTTDLAATNSSTPGFVTTAEEEDEVTITYNRPVNASETSIVFYVPVPTGTYDLYAELTVDGKTKFTKESKAKVVDRGDIIFANINPSTLQGDNRDVKEVTSVNQIDDKILSTTKEDLTVQVTGEVTGSQTIEIPASLSTNTTTFMFENVADDAIITINNETGGAYDGKVIIEIPVNEIIPTVNANVPDGEVYIKQGTVTTLVVSSKKNTTIIGAGVKVGTLTVNQGNVRVEKDGEIGTIENNTKGTLYITNAGGTLPATLPDKTIVVYEDTEHAVILNGKYSTDNITDLMNYGKDVLNTNDFSFTLSAGQYGEVVKVTGGKNITFEPKTVGQEVSMAGLDHQSNGTPSTIVVKNITIDNTLQTEGWFTGTGNNLKPCVGAWGGNFTFEGCKFVVSGESTAETGVMTWWTTAPTISFVFEGCEFVGNGDNASARAMQIYGNVNMEVTDCTFNTYKDYSLKYVGKEGNVATFEGNKVYNSKYLVQLGSALYAGSKYTVNINNTTLGDGVSHYYIDNEEEQMVYIDGVRSVSSSQQLTTALNQNASEIQLQALEGGYVLSSAAKGKEFTLIGSEGVKINVQSVQSEGLDYNLEGSTVTFKNIEIVTVDGDYKGFARPNELIFDTCTFPNTYTTYGSKQSFNGCTFNISGDKYNLWTWGCDDVVLEGCTFNSDGKALLLYGGAGKDTSKNTLDNPTTALTVNKCIFNDNGGLTDLKAAIEIGNDYGATYVLTVNDATVNGYEINDKGINTGTTLWANKNSMGTDKLNVVVDDVEVY